MSSFITGLSSLFLAHGWSVSESANRLGADRPNLINIMSGKRPLGAHTAAKFLAQLACSQDVPEAEIQSLAAAWINDFLNQVLQEASGSNRDRLASALAPLSLGKFIKSPMA